MISRTISIDVDRYVNRFIPRPRLYILPRPISRFLGYRPEPPPPIGNVLVSFWACLGAFCGLLVVEAVFQTPGLKDLKTPLVIASLGATAILEYNTLDSPLAAPRNAVFGQILAAFVGVAITKLFQLSSNFENLRFVAGALSVGIASAVMTVTKTVHPPAGATALLASTSADMTILGWYLIPVILLGTTLMLSVACVLNNIQRQFPAYWWTPMDLIHQEACGVGRLGETGNTVRREESPKEYEKSDKTLLIIEGTHIRVSGWLSLDREEQLVLEELRAKLEARLHPMMTQDTNDTRVEDTP